MALALSVSGLTGGILQGEKGGDKECRLRHACMHMHSKRNLVRKEMNENSVSAASGTEDSCSATLGVIGSNAW
ncbi:Uncharacterized protein BM_BM17826 [Brugia malayi]|uniref:Uncharacterized protein n=1 Tax=Brugia malayi TaxID=6279 RepID=A0A4E9G1W8_BRUMA|nr:Uncharacterized protein BM_BM17826 [Brugia malayi]VIO99356.1 Uncharacterized protein BM_BM17826 [Brugia malayi]